MGCIADVLIGSGTLLLGVLSFFDELQLFGLCLQKKQVCLKWL